jgi:hypothetical protein
MASMATSLVETIYSDKPLSPLQKFTNTRYIRRVGLPTIAINALIITSPDPGAVPGGSTNTLLISCTGDSQAQTRGAEIGSTDG